MKKFIDKLTFLLILYIFSFLTIEPLYAIEQIVDFDKKSLPVLNDELKSADKRLNKIEKQITPKGGIIMWSGAISAIPEGWELCDGSCTITCPNLTDRFVIHADADSGGTRDVGDTGGSHSGGGHTHAAGSFAGPSHTHPQNTPGSEGTWDVGGKIVLADGGSTNGGQMYVRAGGDPGTALTNLGAGVSAGGTGAITGTSGSSTINTIPKFYALAYIIKVVEL